MINFVSHGSTLRYRDKELGDVVEIVLYYTKGDDGSYVKANPERRGIYISIRFIEVTPQMIKFKAYSGKKFCMMELSRLNKKAMKTLAEFLDGMVPTIAATFRDDPDMAYEQIVELRARLMTPPVLL